MICPECNHENIENITVCEKCGFDLKMYNEVYQRFYNEKLNRLNNTNNDNCYVNSNLSFKPRCPYCGSENLTKITTMDKVVNIALFGVFGNKRRYQWHCNNCKTNW